jgi:hypothetical protein
LQEFLSGEGYLSANATGYFGPMTGQAVSKWQAAQGVQSVGSVGPMSRERIKMWCGGNRIDKRFTAEPRRGLAPLTVRFSTQYEDIGTPHIEFGDGTERTASCFSGESCISDPYFGIFTVDHTYSKDGVYRARYFYDLYAGGQRTIAEIPITVGPVSCTKEYNPVCGSKPIVCITTPCNPIQQTYSNRCAMNADGANFVHEGQCRTDYTNPADDPQCKSWFDGCNTCSRQSSGSPVMCTLMACILDGQGQSKPYCKEYFGNSGNKPPTVSSFSGPMALRVNETGTWMINASDPENGQLWYVIRWGDEIPVALRASTVPSEEFMPAPLQKTTFTHAYGSAGTYTVAIVIRDEVGKEAKTSATVKVSSDNVACTMEYAPVCGQTSDSCFYTDPPPASCAGLGWREQKTYGNRCMLNAAGATFLYGGECANNLY